MPLFSVVMPCFNAAAHIEETIASVLAQSFPDFELIVVDDGSTDATSMILDTWAERDRRIRVIRSENVGPSRARNRGATAATGRLIAFIDSDDLWAPGRLAVFRRHFIGADAPDLLYSRVAFFRTDSGTVDARSNLSERDLTVLDLLTENEICTMSNVVVRAETFRNSGGFDPSLVQAEDLEWLVRLAATGARLRGIGDCLLFYRSSPEGLSSNFDAMRAGWWRARATAFALGAAKDPRAVRRAEAAHLRSLARRAVRLGDRRAPVLALIALTKSPCGFFRSPVRGTATLAAAFAAPLMPARLKRKFFS